MSQFPVFVEFGKGKAKMICEVGEITYISSDDEGKAVINVECHGEEVDEKYETSRDKYKAAMEKKYGTPTND